MIPNSPELREGSNEEDDLVDNNATVDEPSDAAAADGNLAEDATDCDEDEVDAEEIDEEERVNATDQRAAQSSSSSQHPPVNENT